MRTGDRRFPGRWTAAALLALLAAAAGPPPARGDVPGVVYNGATGHWYKYVSSSGSWSSAKAGAEAIDGYLATETTDAERAWIDQYLRPSGTTMWLGGTDASVEGNWTWLSGETWAYSNWNSGEPNNVGNEDCLMVNGDGSWNDVYDSYVIPGYVVEWNTDPNAPPPPVLPPDPSDLTAVLNSTGTVTLAWSDNSTNESKFEVERKTPSTAFARVALLSPNVVTWDDENLLPQTDYTYRVRAGNSVGPSGYTNEATVTTGTWAPSPPAPLDLEVVDLASTSVTIRWTDNSLGETGFNLYQRLGTGSYEFLGKTDPDVVSADFPGLAPDATYGFAVRAVGSLRVSSAAEIEATTTGTLQVATRSGDLKDSTQFGKDSVKAGATWEFLGDSDGEADPVAEGLLVRVGADEAPEVLGIAAADPGWKGKAAKWKWKSPRGSLRKFKVQVDLDQRLIVLSGAGLEFSAAPGATMRVSLVIGDDAGTDRRAWPATTKAGVFKYRE